MTAAIVLFAVFWFGGIAGFIAAAVMCASGHFEFESPCTNDCNQGRNCKCSK